MQVMSVTGPIAAEDLGRTLVHEHIIIGMPGEELDPVEKLQQAEREGNVIPLGTKNAPRQQGGRRFSNLK